jgi:hypothetical protein
VDARTRKMVGMALVAVGVVVALVGVFADSLGLGGEGPDDFGGKQVAALVVGLVIAAVGIAAMMLPVGSKGSVEATE